MRFTLRQLEVFLATAHTLNVTKAAESLAMSQSAASGALKDLESQFNIQLFDRVGKRLQVNELGQRVRALGESLLAQAKELENELAQHDDLGSLHLGPLNVGATLTIGNYLCVDLIKAYTETPGAGKVSLEVANTARIVEEILNFDIDLGLIEGELHHPDLDIIPWREDRLICFSHPDHPLAKKAELNDDDLRQAPWILRERGSGTRQAFDRAMAGIVPQLNIILELQHTEAIKRAVEKNLGVSCLSEIALQQTLDRGDLVALKTPNKNFTRTLYLVIHKNKYRSAGVEKWLRLCESHRE